MEPALPLLPRPGRARRAPASSQRVLAAGYDGPLSLEVFNDVFRQADPERTAIDAMRSLLVLEDRLGAAAARRALDGFAFVEIGVDADSAPDTEALLRAMGFAHAGPHRSKPVQLWEHGDIRDRRQPRRRRRRPRGRRDRRREPRPGGQRGPRRRRCSRRRWSAAAAPARPTSPRSPRPTAPSVFFCGDGLARRLPAHRRDRRRERRASTRIDHITLAQPFEAFDEAGLFYRSVLDLQPSESQELAAPDGLVRSRARGRPRRPRARRAQRARRSPARRAGAELQHVAFACERRARHRARDARARRAAAARCPTTTTTTSAARLELEPALLDALRELGVLYDRERRRRAPALLHGAHRRARVLRGARAARRLRRLRRRQLTRPDGRAARGRAPPVS